MRTILLAACTVMLCALSACTTVTNTWAPFPQQNELTSFADRWRAAPKEGGEVVAMQRLLVKYRDEIYTAAADRSRLEWDSSGLSTYGGLAAVLGALADKTGLLNTGVAAATLGLTNSSRYKFHQQTQIYVSALKRVACITGKVNSISDGLLSQAKGASDAAAKDAATNFVNTVIASTDYVRTEYTNGLLGLSPTVPSREELLALVGTFRQPVVGQAGTMSADQVAAQAAADAAGVVVKALAADVQNCSKL